MWDALNEGPESKRLLTKANSQELYKTRLFDQTAVTVNRALSHMLEIIDRQRLTKLRSLFIHLRHSYLHPYVHTLSNIILTTEPIPSKTRTILRPPHLLFEFLCIFLIRATLICPWCASGVMTLMLLQRTQLAVSGTTISSAMVSSPQ